MNNDKSISIIGAGHLGSALIRGLLRSNYLAKNLTVSNRNPQKLARLVNELGVNAAETNIKAVETADILVLAVKPQFMQKVCQEIATAVQKKRPLIISLVAVIDLENITTWLGIDKLAIVRVMTNTPIEFEQGISALFANPVVSPEQKGLCEAVFNAVGSTLWIDQEKLLDPLTAAIGSAPAYVLLFMEALQKAAESQGIPEKTAAKIAMDVFAGTATLAKSSGRSFAELRAGVTTPQGITEHSLKELALDDFFDTFKKIYKAANERIEQIKNSS